MTVEIILIIIIQYNTTHLLCIGLHTQTQYNAIIHKHP